MTGSQRPSGTTELDDEELEALSALESRDPETLRAVASYLEDLASWKERRDESGDDDDDEDSEYPEGVPERASVSVEEVAGTEIRYYQWWEDDEIRSATERR